MTVDILVDFPGWTTTFEPKFRQEQSRVAGGRTYVKDLGSPLWSLTAQSKRLTVNQMDEWRARLEALRNGLETFWGYSLSRCYPIAYPNGSWPAKVGFTGYNAQLHTIDSDRASIRVKELPNGFELRTGDLLSIGSNRDLHRVTEDATADNTGLTPLFSVFPHVWPDVVVGVGVPAVSVRRASCIMAMVPGSLNSQTGPDGRGVITFQGIEAR